MMAIMINSFLFYIGIVKLVNYFFNKKMSSFKSYFFSKSTFAQPILIESIDFSWDEVDFAGSIFYMVEL